MALARLQMGWDAPIWIAPGCSCGAVVRTTISNDAGFPLRCKEAAMQVRPEFARFGVADPGRLGAYLERRSFAQGDCLMRQGTAGGECYFIEEGEVRLEVGEGRWSRTKTAARNRSSSGRAPLRLQGDHPAVGADGGQVLSHCLANRDRSDGGCAPSAPVAGRPAPAAGRPATSNDASNARSGSAGGATVARLAIGFLSDAPWSSR
jgi:hypothetical protein